MMDLMRLRFHLLLYFKFSYSRAGFVDRMVTGF